MTLKIFALPYGAPTPDEADKLKKKANHQLGQRKREKKMSGNIADLANDER